MLSTRVFLYFGFLWICHLVPLIYCGDSQEQLVFYRIFCLIFFLRFVLILLIFLCFILLFRFVFSFLQISVRMKISCLILLSQFSIFLLFHSVHIKLHVPQIVKKHTHTRTIFKHHYVKPKYASSKSLVDARLDPTLKLSRKLPHSLAALESGRLKGSEQIWKPSMSEYRSVDSNHVPKKFKLNKKKNPFKLLEIMAEAQAEGHKFNPQSIYNDDYFDNEGNEHIPEYMLSDNSRFAPSADVYQTADLRVARNSGHKTDLSRFNSDEKSGSPSFVPSWGFTPPTIETAQQTYDWSTGLAKTDYRKHKLFSSALDSDESSMVTPKMKRLRSKGRLTPTIDPLDDHSNVLKMARKPSSLSNFTKYKNKLNVMSSLNTSI